MMPCRVHVAGVGGQGSLTLSRLLGEAALLADLNVVVSEVHGMSQRGGVVESDVLIGDLKSPLIGAGEADVLVAFEPAEALRACGYVSAKSVVLVNMRRTLPFTVALGLSDYPDTHDVMESLRGVARAVQSFDAQALAELAGSSQALNMVMMGALSRLDVLPFGMEILLRAIAEHTPASFRDTNLRAFELGRTLGVD